MGLNLHQADAILGMRYGRPGAVRRKRTRRVTAGLGGLGQIVPSSTRECLNADWQKTEVIQGRKVNESYETFLKQLKTRSREITNLIGMAEGYAQQVGSAKAASAIDELIEGQDSVRRAEGDVKNIWEDHAAKYLRFQSSQGGCPFAQGFAPQSDQILNQARSTFRKGLESAPLARLRAVVGRLEEDVRATTARKQAEQQAEEGRQAAARAEQQAAADRTRAEQETVLRREDERRAREAALRQEELDLQRQLREEERALREAEQMRASEIRASSEASEQRRLEAEIRREEMQQQFQERQFEAAREREERAESREQAREDREAAREALMLQLELAREGLAPSPFGPPAGAFGPPGFATGLPPGFGPPAITGGLQIPGQFPGQAFPGQGFPGQFPGIPGQHPGFPGALPGAGLGPFGVSVPPQAGAFTPAPGPGVPLPQVFPPSFMPPYQQSQAIQASAGAPGGFFQPASFAPGSELFGMGDLGVANARVINTHGTRAPLAGAKIKMGYKLHGPRNGVYIMERGDGSRFEVPAGMVEAGATQPITEDDGEVIYEPPGLQGGFNQPSGGGVDPQTAAAIRDIATLTAQTASDVVRMREERALERERRKSGLPSLSFDASESFDIGGGGMSWVVPLGLVAVGVGVVAFARKKKK